MAKSNQKIDKRKFMLQAIDVMNQSIQEPRDDKVSPKVGAVLIKSNGDIETAFRGELREGDHAEFTLLERKNRATPLEGSILFATLEPCAPGARRHPKLGCAERIVNARIKKVYIGVEDPDPTVDRKGIQYLLDNDVDVEMFDADLQDVIWKANETFKEQAEKRAKEVKQKKKQIVLSNKEKAEPNANLNDISEEQVNNFISKANLGVTYGSEDFIRIFTQLGLLEMVNKIIKPTGIGLLLFGKRPQLAYQHALIRATYKKDGKEDIKTIEGPLVTQADKIQSWYETKIGSSIDRSQVQRKVVYDYPLVVFREAIVNAIVHRDYDIEGAPIYFEINDDAIIIKSPGYPVAPIKLEQIISFNAPSLSRNPKIMYVFDQLELVEQRGLGFQTIKELPTVHGLPLPIVTFEEPYLVMTFPRSSESVKKVSNVPGIEELNEEELAGYDWVKLKGEVSTSMYADHFGFKNKKAQRHLRKMRDLNIIKDNEEPNNSSNYRYVFNSED